MNEPEEYGQLQGMLELLIRANAQSQRRPGWADDTISYLTGMITGKNSPTRLTSAAMTVITVLCQYVPEEMPAPRLEANPEGTITAWWETPMGALTVEARPDHSATYVLPMDSPTRRPRSLSHRSTRFADAASEVLKQKDWPRPFPPASPLGEDAGSNEVLAHRLRVARMAKGMTQRELSVTVGLNDHNGMISNMEVGRGAATWKTMVALATTLNVSLDYLAGAGQPYAPPFLPLPQVDPMFLAHRLKEARTASGMTQQQLAQALSPKVGNSMISQVERGNAALRWEHIVQAAQLLNVSLDDLAGTQPKGHAEPSTGFGENLRAARLARNMTQEALAQALGPRYDHSVISRVESGKATLRLEGLAKAARILAVSTDQLLGLQPMPTGRQGPTE